MTPSSFESGKFRRFALALALVVLFPFGGLAGEKTIDPGTYVTELTTGLDRVTEFRFIRAEAEKLGVRVWLFGGTAAGFAHYVKWDHLRRNGDGRYQADRFDYDFTNIYRSTQDLDLVVDGTPEKIATLRESLAGRFPQFLGDKKNKWELRSLRQSSGTPNQPGYKEALLDSFDFLNQDTDSHSTGMIEVTNPVNETDRVVDLKGSGDGQSVFLRDVLDARLTFYREARHFDTSRAKTGNNPEILAATRAIVKAVQFELSVDASQRATIETIIREFDPSTIPSQGEVHRRLSDIGKKLIQNAVDVEYASRLIDELGLKAKLVRLGDSREIDSMSWWLTRKPLESHPVGRGSGATAYELGLSILAHETNNFLSYESITRAHTGDPNFLASREGVPGEMAAHGEGLYTMEGRQGARETGLTIRFTLDPRAREGTDFVRPSHGMVLVKNRAAVRVIPESLNMTLEEYFEMLSSSEFDKTNLALVEKLRRRMDRDLHALSKSEIVDLTSSLRTRLQGRVTESLLHEALALDFLEGLDPLIYEGLMKHPKFLLGISRSGSHAVKLRVRDILLIHEPWASHRDLVERILPTRSSLPGVTASLDLQKLEIMMRLGAIDSFDLNFRDVARLPARIFLLLSLTQPGEKMFTSEFVERSDLMKDRDVVRAFVDLTKEKIPGFGDSLYWDQYVRAYLQRPESTFYPELVAPFLENATLKEFIVSQRHWKSYLARTNSRWMLRFMPASVLSSKLSRGEIELRVPRAAAIPRCESLFTSK